MVEGLLLLPLGCFVVAAAKEFRRPNQNALMQIRIIEVLVGTIASISLALPLKFWISAGASSDTLSVAMMWVALLVGFSALFSKYASKLALSAVVFGCSVLALLWYFNRVMV